MYGVILAGGSGKRFWPYSRAAKPKQFLDITGEGSMLALTYRRLAALMRPDRIFVLTLEELAPLVRKEIPRLSRERIFAEPVGRNTAPSIAVASVLVRRMGGDEPFLVCPADHTIADERGFRRAVRAAEAVAAKHDVLVTFGVVPSYPSTGYGYIEAGRGFETRNGFAVLRAKRFHEKPGAKRAAAYVKAGRFFWNSGIFLWRPSVFMDAWTRHLGAGRAPLDAIGGALGTKTLRRVVAREYPRMPAISVDYGILEKAGNVVVVPVDVGWSDVGSWDSLMDLLRVDGLGNAGAGRMELIDSRNNLFFNPGGMTAAVGVDDLIVAVDGKTVLVCRRGESQRVREITDGFETKKRKDLL
ncbi:MAG: sugar phosphate nucleotidyltransferase [Candidatus Krumholzibacteria bacterium]|nr:sugar phosphate nucleotidyltransferase [Candidatus Krumholzibacteria bacterium]